MTHHYEHPSLHPAGTQFAMTGDDWTSERDKKRQAKAEAAHKAACLKAATKMLAAADALNDVMRAYLAAGYPDKLGQADGRRRLAADLRELAGYWQGVHGC